MNRNMKRHFEHQELIRKEQEQLKMQQRHEEMIREQQENQSYIDNHAFMRKSRNQRRDFAENVEKSLLSEALFLVLNKSIKSVYENAETLERHLINKYIEENGSYNILNKMCGTSYLLSEFVRNIQEHKQTKYEKAKETNIYEVDDQDRESFYNDLDTEELADVADSIKHRVTLAVTGFEVENETTKRELEDSMEISREKINSQMNQAFKEDMQRTYVKEMRTLRDERPKGIFNTMVLNILESSFKDPDLKIQFFTEQNHMPDVERIAEHTKELYGFLETMISLKLVDEKDIPEFIDKNVKSLKM